MTAPTGSGGVVDADKVAESRVHISVLFALARAEGFDRYFGTPRGRVGGFESAELEWHGLPATGALLPVRGNRWPDAAIRRCEQIAHNTSRMLRIGASA